MTGRHLAITAAINDYAEKKIESLHLDYPEDHRSPCDPGSGQIPTPRGDRARLREPHHHRSQRGELRPVCLDGSGRLQRSPGRCASIKRACCARTGRSGRNPFATSKNRCSTPEAFDILDETAVTAKGYVESPAKDDRTSCQTEKYPVKPMFIDEAVLQMEMSARQFSCSSTPRPKRSTCFTAAKKGDFGLIQPTFQ